MSRILIVNADDFGMSAGVNKGIIESHVHGIVTSTTLMTNMPHAGSAIEMARDTPKLGIGLHLNLTVGKPLSSPGKLSRLVDGSGMFRKDARTYLRSICGVRSFSEIHSEICKQLEFALDHGVQLTHVDSHQGIHRFPAVAGALRRAMAQFGLAALRNQYSPHWAGIDGGRADRVRAWCRNLLEAHKNSIHGVNNMLARSAGFELPLPRLSPNRCITKAPDLQSVFSRILQTLRPGVSEFIVHPGYPDGATIQSPTYQAIRDAELAFICNEKTREIVVSSGVELANFSIFRRKS